MINKKNMLSIIGLIFLVLTIVACNIYPNNPPESNDEKTTETSTEPELKTAEIVINEVNTQGNHPDAETDFIELYNTTISDITLENNRWFITDSKNDPNDPEADLSLFKAISGTITAKAYLIILCGIEGSVEENVVDFSLDSNEGVYLYYLENNDSYTLIDKETWTEHQNSGGSVPDGSTNWVPVNISPGARNVDLAVPTPDITVPDIVINEINTFGDDFIELYNKASSEFTLAPDKWFITDDDNYPEPDPAVLQQISGTSSADGFFVINCDSDLSEGDGLTTVNFGLGSNEQLYLYYMNEDNTYAPIASLKWTEHQASGGLVPDGIGDWTYPIIASAGSSNNNATPPPTVTPNPNIADIVINEIHTQDGYDVNGTGYDYIELYNNEADIVSLAQGEWFLTDSDMDPNLNATALEAISGAMLRNGYLLILCKSGTGGDAAVSFGLGSSESLYLYYYNGAYYSLVNSTSWSEHQTSGGLVPDGSGTWTYPITPSPGDTNQ